MRAVPRPVELRLLLPLLILAFSITRPGALPAPLLPSSDASLIRCASPPDSVLLG